jgi:hypothetical protein
MGGRMAPGPLGRIIGGCGAKSSYDARRKKAGVADSDAGDSSETIEYDELGTRDLVCVSAALALPNLSSREDRSEVDPKMGEQA